MWCLILTLFFVILFWPYLWQNPLKNFLHALESLSGHGHHIYNFYLGEHYIRSLSPWHYHLVWIFLTTPVLYIVLFVSGFIFIVRRALKRLFKIENSNSYKDLWRGKKELQFETIDKSKLGTEWEWEKTPEVKSSLKEYRQGMQTICIEGSLKLKIK